VAVVSLKVRRLVIWTHRCERIGGTAEEPGHLYTPAPSFHTREYQRRNEEVVAQ
jgi:hypothetical protein